MTVFISLLGCGRDSMRGNSSEQPSGSTLNSASSVEVAPLREAPTANSVEDDEPVFYTVAAYDVQADPAEQLRSTLKRAKAEGKTVLLQVGGDWCVWCKRMSGFMETNASVRDVLDSSYLLQKVTYDPENRNEGFLAAYPKITGYPHLFVLDGDGNLMHSQNTEELEAGEGYSEQAFLEFLNRWKQR
jgi:thiol:disulfide interchange protein